MSSSTSPRLCRAVDAGSGDKTTTCLGDGRVAGYENAVAGGAPDQSELDEKLAAVGGWINDGEVCCSI